MNWRIFQYFICANANGLDPLSLAQIWANAHASERDKSRRCSIWLYPCLALTCPSRRHKRMEALSWLDFPLASLYQAPSPLQKLSPPPWTPLVTSKTTLAQLGIRYLPRTASSWDNKAAEGQIEREGVSGRFNWNCSGRVTRNAR